MGRYENLDYWFNLVIDNLTWIILWGIFIFFVLKIPQAFYVSYKLLKGNRGTMGSETFYHRADIFLETCWYNLYGIPKSDLSRSYYSRIQLKEINFNYKYMVEEFLRLNLIYLDTHDNRYKATRSLKNRIIVVILEFYLVCIVGDKVAYYKHLKAQFYNHRNPKNK